MDASVMTTILHATLCDVIPRWSLQPSGRCLHRSQAGHGPQWTLQAGTNDDMDAALPIVTIAALLGAIIGFVGPLGWRWQLLRLSPVLLLPLALHVLQTTPWIFGGGSNWVTAALLVWVGSLGYLPAVLAIAVLRWMMWRQR